MFVCRLVTSRWSKGAYVLPQRNNAVQQAGIYLGIDDSPKTSKVIPLRRK